MATVQIKFLGVDDYDSVAALNHRVVARGDGFVSRLDPGVLSGVLARATGFAVGATSAGELVGYRLVQLPRSADDLLDNRAYRGFPELGDLRFVARFAGVVVAPRARRQRLGSTLCEVALATLRARGILRVITTCHPANAYSLRMLQGLGFEVVGTGATAAGHARCLLSARVHEEARADG